MKKILSLLMLLVAIVTGAKADDVYKLQLNGANVEIINGTQSTTPTYFTWSSKHNFNTKFNGCTYDGVSYTSGLKMESATEVYFTTTAASSTVVIVMSTWSNRADNVALDGTQVSNGDTGTTGCQIFTISDVEAGDHTIARSGSECGLFAVTVTEAGTSSDPKITVASTASVTATESGVAATTDVDITGTNLTGTTLTASLSPAVTGLSVSLDTDEISDGSITATATLSYTATENAKGTTTLTISDGTTSKEVTVSYQAKVVSTSLATISEATTWNFSTDVTYSGSGDYQFTGDDLTTEFVYTDLDLTFADTFNSDALAFTGEYPFRSSSKKYAQNGTLHFKTSVPGTITVKFSDTGTSKSATAVKRYLQINGENTEYWTSRENNSADAPYDAQLNVETGEIAVAAGDIYLSGSSAITYIYVTFTPSAAPTTETITIPSDGVLTYVTENALDFSSVEGLTAYVPTGVNSTKTSVATAEVTSVPAGTALLIKGAEGSYDVEIAESATAPAANLFQVSDGAVTGGDDIFAYHKTNKKFQKVASTVTIPDGKCYLVIEGVSGDALDLDFDGEATAVEAIAEANAEAAAPVKVIKNGKLYIGNYNVAGQQVK